MKGEWVEGKRTRWIQKNE